MTIAVRHAVVGPNQESLIQSTKVISEKFPILRDNPPSGWISETKSLITSKVLRGREFTFVVYKPDGTEVPEQYGELSNILVLAIYLGLAPICKFIMAPSLGALPARVEKWVSHPDFEPNIDETLEVLESLAKSSQ